MAVVGDPTAADLLSSRYIYVPWYTGTTAVGSPNMQYCSRPADQTSEFVWTRITDAWMLHVDVLDMMLDLL